MLSPVPLDGLGLGGAILLPVGGVVSAPFAGAVTADLAILGILGKLPFAVLAPALLLARLVRTDGLFRVKSGRLELPLAKTATPQIHPFKVSVFHPYC